MVSRCSSKNTQTTGIRAVKIEPQFDLPINIDQKQSIDLIYEINDTKDIKQIERIAGKCIDIVYPVDEVSELDYLQFIESQFAEYNMSEFDDRLIDKTIFDLIPYYLKMEGLQLPQDAEDSDRIKSLIFKKVRKIKSDEKLVEYLIGKPYVDELMESGSDSIEVSASTYSQIRHRYGINKPSVDNVVYRLQHLLFRNGILDVLSNSGYSIGQPVPIDRKLSAQLRYQALINWADLLLEKLVEGISFNRSRSKYSVRDIIATLAYMAYEKNVERSHNILQLKYQSEIITPGQIRNIIYQNIGQNNFMMAKSNIESVTTKLHQNLFKFAADKLGFFSNPIDIAIDPTWISLKEGFNPAFFDGAMGNVHLEGDGGFKFATGASFTPMSRFSLGVSLVTDKSKLPKIYRRIFLNLEPFTNIGWILADREFDDPENIELVRTTAGKSWIIRLRDHKKIIGEKDYKKLKKDGKATISIGGVSVNAFWKDISGSDFQWIFNKNNDGKQILMSGLPVNETNISDLIKIYPKRWSAETHIRQLKHDFSPNVPYEYALEYLFYLNIASIFYNIYKIIGQSLSPMYGLPLRPRYYEVLWGLAHSTFQCRCSS